MALVALVIGLSAAAAAATESGFNLLSASLLTFVYSSQVVVVLTLLFGVFASGMLLIRAEIRRSVDWRLVRPRGRFRGSGVFHIGRSLMIPFGDKSGTVSGGSEEAISIGPADLTAPPALIVIGTGNAKLPTPAIKLATWNVNGIRARQGEVQQWIFKLATWNVNGIRARQGEVQQWIERERPDVVCLQEIKAESNQVPPALCEMEGYWCYWHGGKGYSGVGLHVSNEIATQRPLFVHPAFDCENRIVVTEVAGITIGSVYVPNGGRDFAAKMRFLEALDDYAASFQTEVAGETRQLVLCGDMNVARSDLDVHPRERKPRAIGQLPEERALIERILSRGLVDLGRTLDPNNDRLFTWWAPWRNLRQRNIGWRLDYVFVSISLAARATACLVQREVGTSDHAPVLARFS